MITTVIISVIVPIPFAPAILELGIAEPFAVAIVWSPVISAPAIFIFGIATVPHGRAHADGLAADFALIINGLRC